MNPRPISRSFCQLHSLRVLPPWFLQARGKSKGIALAMRDLLESTASPIASNLTDKIPLQTLIWSGAGLIQVDLAANTKTMINPGHSTLNDTAHFQPK